MRDTIVGLVLAVLFLGLLFAAPRYFPHSIEVTTRKEVDQIPAGFTGTKFIGAWTLACVPLPTAHRPAAVGAATPARPFPLGRCRLVRGYRSPGGQTVLAVGFRLVGPHKALTMFVRIPPVGHAGDYVLLRLGKNRLRLPVLACQQSGCAAVGSLMPDARDLLLSVPLTQVVLPKQANGTQYVVTIRLDELEPALDGLERAEH